MTDYLTIDALMLRDEKGNFITFDKEIAELKGKCKVLPIARGKLRRLLAEHPEDCDDILIEEHLENPKLTREQIQDLVPFVRRAIINAITEVSNGYSSEDNTELKKN